MSAAPGSSSFWETNLPYWGVAFLVTTITYRGAIAAVLIGLADAVAALLLIGVVVTIGLTFLGYERDPLAESLFSR